MKNIEIRNALKEAGIKHWELAELLNISESTMCVRLRKELSDDEKHRIISIIKANKKGV